MTTICITTTGDYEKPIPADLVNSLTEGIHQHMKAYGLTNIQVGTRVNVPPVPEEK
jgi:hypothetical protein